MNVSISLYYSSALYNCMLFICFLDHEKTPTDQHVAAFRPVLMLMQRPINEEIYKEFLNQTISLSSSREEFKVPQLPIEDSDIIVSLYDNLTCCTCP